MRSGPWVRRGRDKMDAFGGASRPRPPSGAKPSRTALAVLATMLVSSLLAACDFEQQVRSDAPSLWLRFDEASAPFHDREGGRVASISGAGAGSITPRTPSTSLGGDEWAVSKTAPAESHLEVTAESGSMPSLAARRGVTVEAWLTGRANTGRQVLVRRGADWAVSQQDGQYLWEVFDASGAARWQAQGGVVRPDSAQQVVGTFTSDGSSRTATLYVDGAEVATSGPISGEPLADNPSTLHLLEGGPAVLDELIVFAGKALPAARITTHHLGGTTEDECDLPVAEQRTLPEPVTILDTVEEVGADSVSAGVPLTITTGALSAATIDDVQMVELQVTSTADGAATTIWPAGWERPAQPLIPDSTGDLASTVVVGVGEGTALRVETDAVGELRIDVTGYWSGEALRPSVPTRAFSGTLDAGETQEVTTTPMAPSGATAAMLAVAIDPDGTAGELTVPDPTDPDLGGVLEIDFPTATTTLTTLAGVRSGETSIRSTEDVDLDVRVLGWAVNTRCVKAESTPPSLAITTPTTGASIDADAFTFDMSGTVADAGSGIAGLSFTIDGVAVPDLEPDLTDEPGTWSVQHAAPTGTHVLGVTARDFAGNTTTRTVEVTTVVPSEGTTVPAPELLVPGSELPGSIISFDPETNLLVLSSLDGELGEVKPGAVLAVDALPPHLPDGLFHEVRQVIAVADVWHVQLRPAQFLEAFRQIDVSTAPPPGPAQRRGEASGPSIGRDIDGIDACLNGSLPDNGTPDQEDPGFDICAGFSGRIDIGLDFALKIRFDWGRPRLERFRAVAFADITTTGYLEAAAAAEWQPDGFELAEFELPRIPIWGPVHVAPEIDIDLLMLATVEAALRLEVTEFGFHFEAGAEHEDGDTRGVFAAEPVAPDLLFPDNSLSRSAGLAFEIGPRIELELLVNGLAGPQVWVDPVKLKTAASVEQSVDPTDPDSFRSVIDLEARLMGEAGVNLAIELDTPGPFDFDWETESLTAELYDLVSFLDFEFDLGRACDVDDCGHLVLPNLSGYDSTVLDTSDDGIAVGSGWDTALWQTVPVMWDASAASPAAEALPLGSHTQGEARRASPGGQHAIGTVGPTSAHEHIARWDLTGSSPTLEVAPELPGEGTAVPCSINDAGTALYLIHDGTPDQKLVRWRAGTAPELIGLTGTTRYRRDVCSASIMADDTVVAGGDGGIYGPLIFVSEVGQPFRLLAPGTFRAVNDDGLVVGEVADAAVTTRAAVWSVDDPSPAPVRLSERRSTAEGVDNEGNVYGSGMTGDGPRNIMWRADDDGYREDVLGTTIRIWDVAPSGWLFGLGGEPADGDDGESDAPRVMQWHDQWYVDVVGGGDLGTYMDTDAGEKRTVYFGEGRQTWHKSVNFVCWGYGPTFPFFGPAWPGPQCT